MCTQAIGGTTLIIGVKCETPKGVDGTFATLSRSADFVSASSIFKYCNIPHKICDQPDKYPKSQTIV